MCNYLKAGWQGSRSVMFQIGEDSRIEKKTNVKPKLEQLC